MGEIVKLLKCPVGDRDVDTDILPCSIHYTFTARTSAIQTAPLISIKTYTTISGVYLSVAHK